MLPIATSSGEALEKRVGDPGEHAELGDQLIWFAIPLLVLSLRWSSSSGARPRASRPIGPSALPDRRSPALAVVAALATGVQVYRVGDSGARAAWGDQVASSSGD